MILDPKEIGWSILDEERDPRIYSRLAIVPCGTKAANLPDYVDRMYWPSEWPNKKYNEIGIFHVIERADDLIKFWKDLYQICEHGTFVKVYGNYWASTDTFADPTYKRGISDKMFDFVSAIGRKRLEDDLYDDGVACGVLSDVDFDVRSVVPIVSPLWEGKADYERDYFITHYLNVARKIEVRLMAHKPVRKID